MVLPDQSALKRLSEGLLQSAGRTGVRGNLLEVHHPSAPLFDPVFLHTASEVYGLAISLNQDDDRGFDQKLHCESSQLPFQDGVFQIVVLHHVISDGREPELAECVRVLARDGVLILLGLNRLGWRYRTQSRIRRLPGLAPLKVRSRLDGLNMTMQGFAGAGLFGMTKPVWMHSGLGSIGTPLADIVLLQARHRDSPEVTPLRFRKPRAGVVQSAAICG
ncbi:MAG: class I SAM-dependent methyltransferase [Xanthomonadales bacterium]|jgi:SAM-dependent methyltransferase|nr:class I SAM-dependent methyltransferase [Xanthomonadales bacterium]MDH3923751.1 class I SAM-dependent methyltransferase [Xanthomonadales bacterium]MDH3940016.1 class I SAM-dependent methyltransferase [Xanthomonadales bacterium]MDH4001345.1 class I SAM-dependent methyltransferase [Xanthomonadales bacterium]